MRNRQWLLAALGGTAVTAVSSRIVQRYRRDLNRASARLDPVDRRLIATRFGAQEYAESGEGEPLLVSHGLLHGCDGGLWSARDLVPGCRLIAPSRFGYLGSVMPPDATPADQADAYALLLDDLGIGQVDVIGISAGATSALQFALRHPDRIKHLVIMSGNLPGNPTATAPPNWARAFYTDAAMWALKTVAPAFLNRAIGVPSGFPHNPDEARTISEMIDSIFPVAPRAQGAVYDVFISNPDVNSYPLEAVPVPTLLVHAQDDPLTSYEAAQRAAKRIAGSVLVSMESGGHLGLGQTDRVQRELVSFVSIPMATR
jgi:pimeloyl-ACP methyl ester carboxylesterase